MLILPLVGMSFAPLWYWIEKKKKTTLINECIHIAANVSTSFFFYGWVVFHYINHIFLIQSSVDAHLGCFHVLAIIISAARNAATHVSFQINVFIFFIYIPRSGVAGSYCNSVFSFKEPPYCFPQWLHQFTFLPTV